MPPTADKSAAPTVEYFLEDARVKACLQLLDDKFRKDGNNSLVVSDVLDKHGHQYVNLVQKGGGVLGIALAGYTYVLEYMGIRFLRLAGTSAGAINTALIAVIGNKEEPKSKKVLEYMCGLKFFSLVDGHPTARWIIKHFITDKHFSARIQKWLIGIVAVLALLLVSDFIFLGLQAKFEHPWSKITRISFVLTGFFLLFIAIIVVYFATLMKRLKESGYGINPGDFFYTWIKDRLHDNGITTVSSLIKKAEEVPEFQLRPGVKHPEGLSGLKGDVTFITSEVVTQNKVQFPKMCHLFRHPNEINELQPAGFIRASMAIPIFFESYYINDIPCKTDEMKKAWTDEFNESDPPQTARFVDGGILSNFPVDIFYRPEISIPRMPVFGIDLDDTEPRDQKKHAVNWSLFGYFGRLFNTVRFYYDKDFLLKNKMFNRGIGKVPLPPSQFNWLNFFVEKPEMKDMFIIGVEQATKFLIDFDWKEYKKDRKQFHHQLLNR